MSRTLATIAAALALSGCHRLVPGGVPCSARGGPEWREYRSKHFVIASDLDRAGAAKLVADLERMQALVVAALIGPGREIPGTVRVVAPARGSTYGWLAPAFSLGFFKVGSLGEPTIVLHPAALEREPEVIAHELAHHLAWYAYPRQPLWFAEGLVRFVQTVATDTPGHGHVVGVVPRVGILLGLKQVPAKDLLIPMGRDYPPSAEPTWSWILYSWLWNQRPRQLTEFQRRLALADWPLRAWKAAFPDLDPGDAAAMRRLDDALYEHSRRGELVYYRVDAPSDPSFDERPLPPAEIHLLGYAAGVGSGPADVDAALADDPLHPVALALRAWRHGASAVAALRASAAARPADWRTWILLALELGDDDAGADERIAAYRKAIELNPSSPLALNNLAWHLARRGRIAEALPFARRAVDLAPGDAAALDTLARIALDAGACEEALSLQRRAVDAASNRRAPVLLEHLAETEKRCAGQGPAAPAASGAP